MATEALIYLSPGLPITVSGADRLVYLPDGSQHVLDKYDRPLFSAPASAGVCIVMQYTLEENPQESQVAPFAREIHMQKLAEKQEEERRVKMAADETQQFPKIVDDGTDMVNVNTNTGSARAVPRPLIPIPATAQVSPLQQRRPQHRAPQQNPGGVSVRKSSEVPDDVTGETVVPDFQTSPSGETGKTSSARPKSVETEQISGRGREAG